MENKMEAIICSNVNKSYGKKEVLKNIDFIHAWCLLSFNFIPDKIPLALCGWFVMLFITCVTNHITMLRYCQQIYS